MRHLENIFWLGSKELRSVLSDIFLVGLILWSFSFAIYADATASSDSVNNASIAIVDEDRSALSRAVQNAFYPPFFKNAETITAEQLDRAMDRGRYMFVLSIPPDFEKDVRKGVRPSVQINIDATAVGQAGLGAGYIRNIVLDEVDRYVLRADPASAPLVILVERRAFNPNGSGMWFSAIVSLLDQISMLTIILTGAALLREREHGTIEHLLVMPINALQIVVAKVWANGLVILAAAGASLLFVIEGLLEVPVAGSKLLLLGGSMIYLFAAATIGVFLATIARTMAQFSLLMMMTIIPMMMLSGGMTPIESQPEMIRPITWFLPSRHYVAFSQAVVFRGAGLDIVWPQLLTIVGLGAAFFTASLALFQRSISESK